MSLPRVNMCSTKMSTMPDINTLRRIPKVSESVAGILANYEAQTRNLALQGKTATSRRSGRYNTVDAITAEPSMRWPNEGYHGGQGRKRVMYAELTLLPGWVTGQLLNIYYIKDHDTARHALLQTIHSMRDATSLPWPTVRNAYAVTMHDIEEGTLTWSNATQWSINRLSASQIAMNTQSSINMNSTSNQMNQKRICCYYNDGLCTHDSHHGQYRHHCNFCARNGRTNSHPETKCHFKARSRDTVSQAPA